MVGELQNSLKSDKSVPESPYSEKDREKMVTVPPSVAREGQSIQKRAEHYHCEDARESQKTPTTNCVASTLASKGKNESYSLIIQLK